jgi:hypothetical protein
MMVKTIEKSSYLTNRIPYCIIYTLTKKVGDKMKKQNIKNKTFKNLEKSSYLTNRIPYCIILSLTK